MIVLDTSILSIAYRRAPSPRASDKDLERLRALIVDDVDVCVPGIVKQELLSGVRGDAAFGRLEAELTSFRLLLADRETHVTAAAVRNRCIEKGVAATGIDCLVAAHAIQVGGQLFALDQDFRHIAKHTPLQLLRV